MAEDADNEEEIMNVERKVSKFHGDDFIISFSNASQLVTGMHDAVAGAAQLLAGNGVHKSLVFIKQRYRCIHICTSINRVAGIDFKS